MNVSVRVDIKDFEKSLTDIEKKYLPNATKNAINDTLFGVRDSATSMMSSVFDKPVAFTTSKYSWYIRKEEKATTTKQSGVIRLKDKQESYLKYQVFGGNENPVDIAIPVPQENQYASHGGLKRNWKNLLNYKENFSGAPRKKGHKHIIGENEGRGGIYKRIGKRTWDKSQKRMVGQRFLLMISWEHNAKYKMRFDFESFAEQYARKNFSNTLREKLDWYIKNRA